MHPFVFFPIFAPYSQWNPDRGTNTPENAEVNECMEQVFPGAQPFISTWYCLEFLKRSALSDPSGFDYNGLARSMEAMLLWSFHMRASLLDWDEHQLWGFLNFYVDPPAECTTSSNVTRFIQNNFSPFRDWQINPDWRLFKRINKDGSLRSIVCESRTRLVTHVRRFFEFYLSVTMSTRENPVGKILRNRGSHLAKAHDLPVLTEHQLDWLFEFAITCNQSRLHTLDAAVYLAFARYTNFTAKSVIGSHRNTATLDQIRLEKDGGWSFSPTADDILGSWQRLPTPFNRVFEAHLRSLHIDSALPLPAYPLFPQLNGVDGNGTYVVKENLDRFRVFLAEAARSDEDPEIAEAADSFSKLSYRMVRRSACKH